MSLPLEDPVLAAAAIKSLALAAGFARVGIASARPLTRDKAHLDDWISAGRHGQMEWLARDTARRSDPGRVVEGARSVVMLALDYDSDAPRSADRFPFESGTGWISRYAWGDDYHGVIEHRLKSLAASVGRQIAAETAEIRASGREVAAPLADFSSRRDFRYYVDHGPILERAWAALAGLGWRGKHGLIVDPQRGSYFFLAAIVTTLELACDTPISDHCGSCTACVDVCPTHAIVEGRTVDARKCISYLNIEAPLPLNEADSALLHGHLFGCDLCQDVCPFNRFSHPGDPAFAPRVGAVQPSVDELAVISDEEFRSRFRASPIKRRKPAGLREIASLLVEEPEDGGEVGS